MRAPLLAISIQQLKMFVAMASVLVLVVTATPLAAMPGLCRRKIPRDGAEALN